MIIEAIEPVPWYLHTYLGSKKNVIGQTTKLILGMSVYQPTQDVVTKVMPEH